MFNELGNFQIARKFPPSKAYVHNLLKHVILAAEGEGEEVMDVLYQEHVSSSSSFNINSHEVNKRFISFPFYYASKLDV